MSLNIALVIISCDKYKDTWEPFFTCINKFWPSSDMKKYLVNNEETDVNYDVSIINTGPEISWSSKVRYALTKISEDYIFLLLDDYFFDSSVNEQNLYSIFDFIENLDIDYLSFEQAKAKEEFGNSLIAKISLRNIYGKVLQPAIWKKSYLQKCLYDDDFSAWEFEGRQKNKSEIRVIGNDCCVKKRLISWQNGVLQGKWYPTTIKKLNAIGITINTENREILSGAALFKYRMKFFFAKHLPLFLALPARKTLERIGFKFVTKRN